jgi:dihydrolipoamide dehydrogenase
MEPCDLAVIGAGPGGYVAALRAAQLGLSVVLIERDKAGGTCLHRGCIPSKALIHGARVLDTVRKAAEFGVNTAGAPTLDYATLTARKDKTVAMLEKGVEFLLQKRGVKLVKGNAKFQDQRLLKLERADGTSDQLSFSYCIIATGGVPTALPKIPTDGETFVTSNEVLRWTALPKSVLVVGAGVIGCEFASMFARMGVQVTVVEKLAQALPGFDEDVAREIGRALKKQGVDLRLDANIKAAAILPGANGNPPLAELTVGEGDKITAEKCIVAVGRKPTVEHLDAKKAGLATNSKGAIEVDECCRTSVAGIYAIGDVTGVAPLAHVASHMGIVAAEQIAGSARGGRDLKFDKTLAPWAVFTEPEVAAIGLSEQAAKAEGREIKVGKFPFRALGKAQATGEYEGFVKVIADAKTGRLLGFHAVSSEATNLLGEASLAWAMEAGVEDLAEAIHAHPTFPEAVGEAALVAMGMGLHAV